jgi:ferredoxin, 2Fe-2S
MRPFESAIWYSGDVAKVTILPAGDTYEFDLDTMPYDGHGKPKSFLDVAENFGFHLEHACGGSCACTTCHIVVKQGGEWITEMEDDEADRLDMAADLQMTSRLGCQAVITSNEAEIVIEIPTWNRNYVSEGGGSMNLGDAIPAPKK